MLIQLTAQSRDVAGGWYPRRMISILDSLCVEEIVFLPH